MNNKTTELKDRLSQVISAHIGTRLSFAHSLGVEDSVIMHALSELGPPSESVRIFTLDTGRLAPESYLYLEQIRHRYKVNVEVFFPDRTAVEELMTDHGTLSFYDGIEQRKTCCRIRKVEPLKRALAESAAWIVGLRAAQSSTRGDVSFSQADALVDGLIKYAPLFDWSEQDVWAYIEANQVPVHRLHRQGYPSIGCAPCTRPVQGWKPGADNSLIDIRSGRWWWENPESKECGLHEQ